MLQHFVLPPTLLIVELSLIVLIKYFFPLAMDVIGQHFVPKSNEDIMILALNRQFKQLSHEPEKFW